MPRQRSKKLHENRISIKNNGIDNSRDEEPNVGDGDGSGPDLDVDENEKELEKLVLGDSSGFLEQLGAGTNADYNSDLDDSSAEEVEDTEGGLEGVDDADLFFLDSGPLAGESNQLIAQSLPEDDYDGDTPVWEDSDDDRLAVSLAGHTRLRKLRNSEGEDIISGREYSKRLRRQFERLHPVPEWAQAVSRPVKRRRTSLDGSVSPETSDDEEMDIDESDLSTLPLARLLQNAGSLVKVSDGVTKRPKLRPEVIDIQRTRDIPGVQPSAISSLSFHPEYPVLLSSGLASTLYLHHIAPTADPTPNPLLTSVHIRKTPLHTSAFLPPAGDRIFFSGRRRYFHTWDLPSGSIQKVSRVYGQKDEQKSMESFKLSPCGRYMALVGTAKKGGGIINILDTNTTQWIAAARIEGRSGVADYAWWSDGEGLTVVGKGGEVGEWSLESRSFLARWIDDGYAPTVLALGGHNGPAGLGGDRWVVIGSHSGIINIYDRRAFISTNNEISVPERPQPKRSFDQLHRPATILEISPDGQLLAMSTKWEKDALRLVHLPSCTVYRNWPTSQTPLGRVTAVAFGSGSDILAVGNDQGKIRLFEIRA